jgi:response regulator RpfG family c-di-GMP phosphodiesterase
MSFTNALLLRRSSRPGAVSSAPPAREGEAREKLGRVVLADSESADLEHMASILRGMGFTVVTAQDGRSAMGLIRRHSPVLVLATLDLPILNGYMLAQKLREHPETENTPFMFILRAGEIPDQMVGHETFAHDYIQKPFSIQEFKRRVMALLNLVQHRSTGKVTAQEGRPFLPPASRSARSALEWLHQLKAHLEEMSAILDHLENRLAGAGAEGRAQRPETPEEFPRPEGGERRPAGISAVASKAAGQAPPPVDEVAQMLDPGLDSRHKLVLLEKLRAEFRSRSQDAAGSAGEEDGGAGASGDEWPFDPRLLSPAEVGSCGVPLSRVETEETTQFPRVSMLSIPEEEVVAGLDNLYGRLRAFVLKALRRASLGAAVEYRLAEELAATLQATRDLNPLLQEATRRDQEFSVSGHAANVTVLALCVARQHGCDAQAQFRVALAGLLHELGVVRLPERLVFKEQPLSEEEMRQLRRRPLVSALMLREAGRHLESVVEIVGQVFERDDGSGHPLGLFGSEMREEAKVLALADVFEACIHRRPYRKPLSGYSTLFQLSQSASFSRDLVKALVRAVSLFPLHELLQLTSGEIVEVVAVNPASLSRPRVRVRFETSGLAGDQRELDLSKPGSPEVKRVLTVDELPAHPDAQSA